MEVGQDKELSPKLLSQGEVTHNTALNTVRRTQRHGRKESEIEVLSGVRGQLGRASIMRA